MDFCSTNSTDLKVQVHSEAIASYDKYDFQLLQYTLAIHVYALLKILFTCLDYIYGNFQTVVVIDN